MDSSDLKRKRQCPLRKKRNRQSVTSGADDLSEDQDIVLVSDDTNNESEVSRPTLSENPMELISVSDETNNGSEILVPSSSENSMELDRTPQYSKATELPVEISDTSFDQEEVVSSDGPKVEINRANFFLSRKRKAPPSPPPPEKAPSDSDVVVISSDEEKEVESSSTRREDSKKVDSSSSVESIPDMECLDDSSSSSDEEIADDKSDDEDSDDEASDEDHSLVIAEIAQRKETEQSSPTGQVDTRHAREVSFHPQLPELVIAFDDRIEVFQITNNELTLKLSTLILKPIAAICYKPSGDVIYAVRRGMLLLFAKGEHRFEVDRKKLFREPAAMMAMCSTHFAVVAEDGTIYVVNNQSLSVEGTIYIESDVETISMSESSIYVITGDEVLKISKTSRTIQHRVEAQSYLLCGVVHQSSFVTGSATGISLFKTDDLSFRGNFKISRKNCSTCIAVVEANTIALALDNGDILLFSLNPNAEKGILGTMTTCATRMSVSKDKKWLIANDRMDECKLFDLSNIDFDPPVSKKQNPPNQHLPSSSQENKNDFFEGM